MDRCGLDPEVTLFLWGLIFEVYLTHSLATQSPGGKRDPLPNTVFAGNRQNRQYCPGGSQLTASSILRLDRDGASNSWGSERLGGRAPDIVSL